MTTRVFGYDPGSPNGDSKRIVVQDGDEYSIFVPLKDLEQAREKIRAMILKMRPKGYDVYEDGYNACRDEILERLENSDNKKAP
jgi:hypothetical protein